MLGTTDITTSIVGTIRIDAEESASSICTFSYVPPDGALDLEDYEAQTLTVDISTSAWTYRRFTGVVDVADYSPVVGLVTIRGSTNLQGRLEALDRPTIDALIGGYWSSAIFDDRATGYQYARAQISTVPAEMHVDRAGALRVVDWQAKATPDITITDATRFNDTLSLQRASKRDLLGRIAVTFQYRYPLLRHREYRVTYAGHSFCQYAGFQTPTVRDALTVQALKTAVGSTSWAVYGLSYTAVPDSGTYTCSGIAGSFEWTNNAITTTPMLSGTWTLAKRWAQDITEQYTMTVYAPELEERIGEVQRDETYNLQVRYDTSSFETIKTYTGPPAGSSKSSALAGDYVFYPTAGAVDGRSAAQDAMVVAMHKAATELRKRARRTSVSASIVYRPDMDLSKTVRLESPGLTAVGKVRRVSEVMDRERGALTMTVELAISRRLGAEGAGDDTLTPPGQPAHSSAARAESLDFPLRIGGLATSPPEAASWDGWITNRRGTAEGPVYQTRCSVVVPNIPNPDRAPATVTAADTYAVMIPQDILTLSH